MVGSPQAKGKSRNKRRPCDPGDCLYGIFVRQILCARTGLLCASLCRLLPFGGGCGGVLARLLTAFFHPLLKVAEPSWQLPELNLNDAEGTAELFGDLVYARTDLTSSRKLYYRYGAGRYRFQ
jgi:hypothetical protein